MIPYILHVTVITTVCFLFYKLLLQKETFYRLNRWTLIGCLAISFLLPLLPAPRSWSWRDSWTAQPAGPVAPPVAEKAEFVHSEPAMPVHRISSRVLTVTAKDRIKRPAEKEATTVVTGTPANKVIAVSPASTVAAVDPANKVAGVKPAGGITMDKVVAVLQWLFYLYLFGVIVFGGNFLLQIAVLVYQSYFRPVIRDGRFRIVEISGNRAPCSFGNTIFINPAIYDWETYNQILIHEKVHISGRHTLDILLAEMAVVWQWFNPFAWLYRREVENNLEFLTDASVLEHLEVEPSAYQLSLLRVSAPHLPFSVTNNYNQSLLKRRIVMMNSKRSSLHTMWKYFFLIPLLTGLVCALNKPAAFGAGTKNSPSSGEDSRGRAGKPVNRVFAALADTSKKPRTDSSWSRHDSLAGRELPVLSMGADDKEMDARSAETKMYLDQALQNVNANIDVLTDSKTVLNEQMMQAAVLADVKLSTNLNVQMNMLADVNANIGDLRIAGDTDMLEGAWFATSSSSEDKIHFELKRENENGNWNNSFSVEKSEFNPFPGQGNVEFKLTREAGTLNFKGQFDGQEGFGHFRFAPDETYFNALKQMGLDDEGRRFAFFTLNIKKDYAAMLVKAFPHLSMHELISCAAQHIDADFIKYWQGTGITDLDNPRSLISLKSMHIDRAYVDELKAAGYDHLQLHELISMKSQHIDGSYIRSLGKSKDNEPIPVRDIISYKAMRIDSGYIASLRSVGYSNLDRNQLFPMYSQHVSADFIKGFQDIGYKDLSARDLVSLKVMNITPEYVKSFRDIGYKDIDIRQLHSFKAQNITPEFIKGWRDLGYDDLGANQLASLKAVGVTPDFVREFNKIGFDHIPVNMLGMLKSTGVNAEYVLKMKEKGFVSKDLGKYIRLKNDFN
jgi:hypothetical protein